jgi:hypothetical protein
MATTFTVGSFAPVRQHTPVGQLHLGAREGAKDRSARDCDRRVSARAMNFDNAHKPDIEKQNSLRELIGR